MYRLYRFLLIALNFRILYKVSPNLGRTLKGIFNSEDIFDIHKLFTHVFNLFSP